ncbi:HAMP domain-containing sensor histidine kinase [Haloechinothrix sp. LS1_15]|uniref:sensor histidine kinase n=1 Tax=Haloechinothrix sp. LS1_15 TaxID=2652248 RepID=UPI00294413AE|nr:HAMP domain-containing sensor histidine kinase [Haloechinothrix sp. LS1_15]MDV6011848.1 HAMP domain-containing histidine kinase [Haloechinothrix sp. LS1_15]
MDEILGGVSDTVEEKRLELVTDLAEVSAATEPVRFRQIVGNIVNNAVAYTPAGGRITVTLAGRDRTAALVVTDTGPGIAEDERAHVFRRFFRGASSGQAGSGIGLAVAAELVAAHGGDISVDSEPGWGSRFVVRLPVDGPEGSVPAFIGSSQARPTVDRD